MRGFGLLSGGGRLAASQLQRPSPERPRRMHPRTRRRRWPCLHAGRGPLPGRHAPGLRRRCLGEREPLRRPATLRQRTVPPAVVYVLCAGRGGFRVRTGLHRDFQLPIQQRNMPSGRGLHRRLHRDVLLPIFHRGLQPEHLLPAAVFQYLDLPVPGRAVRPRRLQRPMPGDVFVPGHGVSAGHPGLLDVVVV